MCSLNKCYYCCHTHHFWPHKGPEWKKVLVAQSCPTVCSPVDCSPPGSSVHGILQAGTLERAAIFLPPGGLPSPVIQPGSPALLADSLPSEPPGKPSRWTCHLGHDTWFRWVALQNRGKFLKELKWEFSCLVQLSDFTFTFHFHALEKEMATRSSILAWRIPGMGEPGGLPSMRSLRVGHDWAASLSLFTFMHWRRKWQPTPVFLPGESQGRGSLVACRLWGHTELDTTDAT